MVKKQAIGKHAERLRSLSGLLIKQGFKSAFQQQTALQRAVLWLIGVCGSPSGYR